MSGLFRIGRHEGLHPFCYILWLYDKVGIPFRLGLWGLLGIGIRILVPVYLGR